MTKLHEIYPYNLLDVYTHKSGANYSDGPDPGLVYGLELEIENTTPDAVVSGFRADRDGSLRNNGWEFITNPMTYRHQAARLTDFFATNDFTEINYSERCSVHVHTNCRNLTLNQIATIVLIYQVVEKLLFQFVGEDRESNIFCVPLSETTITHKIIDRIAQNDTDVFRDWHKYTALNLLPLLSSEQGTIEWRHMAGNCNVDFILTWLRLIGHIYVAAKSNNLEYWTDRLKNLNSNSHYSGLLIDIFKEDVNFLMTPGYERLLEDGVLLLKYSLLPNKKKKSGDHYWINEALQASVANTTANIPLDSWVIDEDMRRQIAATRQRLLDIRAGQAATQFTIIDDLQPRETE